MAKISTNCVDTHSTMNIAKIESRYYNDKR